VLRALKKVVEPLSTKTIQAWRGLSSRRTSITSDQRRREVRRKTAARIRAENALEEMRAEFRSIFDNATDVITYVSISGKMLDVNARVEQVFGYRPAEIIGKHFTRLGILPLRDIPRTATLFRKTLRDGKAAKFVELELKHKNGNSVFVEVGTQFIVRDGRVKGVVNIFRDITERRRVMEELVAAKKAAEAANRAKSEFLANMSHEIRTPMTAILGFAGVLSSCISDPAGVDAVRTIQRNAEYLLKIIDDILDLSKIEAGKIHVEPRPCSPFQIVAEVMSLMRVRAEAKNLALGSEYSGSMPEVIQSDPIRLRQILINLIGNAIKFTETGSVRLVTRLVQHEGSRPGLCFEVIDTGVGMTEEQIRGLFKPFAQVHETSAGGQGGTGLGLAITKRLVDMLGGNIAVQSVPRSGTTFTVTVQTGPLDAVRMVNCPDASAGASAPAIGGGCFQERLNCRILLAEDGPDNQKLISLLLRKSGAEVEVAANGQAAVEAALKATNAGRPFDVILMDMRMPVMDGYQATERLRSLGHHRPIVALTAYAMKDDRQKCLDAGCDEYVEKPIDHARLLVVIAEQVASAKAIPQ
jgi:PAS domain S-box-containing protein